jgi:hypothetical protein
MRLFPRDPQYLRDAMRIAQDRADNGETLAQSERGSASWHRLNDAGRAMRQERRTGRRKPAST